MDEQAAIGYDARGLRELQGGDANFLAHRYRGQRTFLPARKLTQDTGRFRWQRHACALSETEAPDVVVHVVLPHAQAHFDGADVARMRQNHRHRQNSIYCRRANRGWCGRRS